MNPAASKLALWRAEPIQYVRQVLHAEPDAWQCDVLMAAARDPRVNPQRLRRLALKASKGPGKSTVLAWIGWWFTTTRPHPKVVATSVTGDNLKDNLWTELAKWQARSELLKARFTWHAERIVCNDHPETWWMSARSWPQSADATKQADALAGVHADFVLFLVDESGGIPDPVVATAEAALANADDEKGTEALLIQAGNPTETQGPLYRACTRERHLWWVMEISGDPDDPKRAPRVSVQWAREQIQKYGRDNPWVLVNVFGQFPPGQSNTLVGVEEAGAAARRIIPPAEIENAPRILGVDVARFGDDRSCFFLRQGKVAFRPKVFRNLDLMALADQVALSIERANPDAVFVDQTGLGAGVVDRLRQLGHVIVGVEFGGKAADAHFLNKRSEMWWLMADWVKAGASIPDDGELISELTSPTYKFDSAGKLALESKAELKARGLPSPDKADALAVTFAAPVAPKRLTLPGHAPRSALRSYRNQDAAPPPMRYEDL